MVTLFRLSQHINYILKAVDYLSLHSAFHDVRFNPKLSP